MSTDKRNRRLFAQACTALAEPGLCATPITVLLESAPITTRQACLWEYCIGCTDCKGGTCRLTWGKGAMYSKRAMPLRWRRCSTRSGSAHHICLTPVHGTCTDLPTTPGTAGYQLISSELPHSWACLVCAWTEQKGTSASPNDVHSIMHGLHNSRIPCF